MECGVICQFEEESDRHLCGRICTVLGNVCNGYPPFPALIKIHYVITGGKDSDIAEVRQCLQRLAVEYGLVRDGDFAAAHPFDELTGLRNIICHDFPELLERGEGKVSRVCCRTVKYSDLHEYASVILIHVFYYS